MKACIGALRMNTTRVSLGPRNKTSLLHVWLVGPLLLLIKPIRLACPQRTDLQTTKSLIRRPCVNEAFILPLPCNYVLET